MDLMSLNNEIVSLRNPIKTAKVWVIRHLSKRTKLLRNKKGTDEQIQKNQRKADRFISKIAELRKLNVDDLSICALRDMKVQESNKANVENDIGFSKMFQCKKVLKAVKAFRTKYPNWQSELPILLKMRDVRRKFTHGSSTKKKNMQKKKSQLGRTKKPDNKDQHSEVEQSEDEHSNDKDEQSENNEDEIDDKHSDSEDEIDDKHSDSEDEIEDKISKIQETNIEHEITKLQETSSTTTTKRVKPVQSKQSVPSKQQKKKVKDVKKKIQVSESVVSDKTPTVFEEIPRKVKIEELEKIEGEIEIKKLILDEEPEDKDNDVPTNIMNECKRICITEKVKHSRPKDSFFMTGDSESDDDAIEEVSDHEVDNSESVDGPSTRRKLPCYTTKAAIYRQERNDKKTQHFGMLSKRPTQKRFAQESKRSPQKFSKDLRHSRPKYMQEPVQEKKEPEILHPSWEAKRKQKTPQIAQFVGKKIVFDE